MQQAIEREHSALAVVLGAQHQQRIFDRDDDEDRPYRRRDRPEHIFGRRRDGGGTEKNLVDRIERRRADVAVNHADRADGEGREPAARGMRPAHMRVDGAGHMPNARLVHQTWLFHRLTSTAMTESDFNLPPKLDDAPRRYLEKLGRRKRVAVHELKNIQLEPPPLRAARRNDR